MSIISRANYSLSASRGIPLNIVERLEATAAVPQGQIVIVLNEQVRIRDDDGSVFYKNRVGIHGYVGTQEAVFRYVFTGRRGLTALKLWRMNRSIRRIILILGNSSYSNAKGEA